MKSVIFTINFRWQVVISFNLKPSLKKKKIDPPTTTNNNPSPKIYCENIVKML